MQNYFAVGVLLCLFYSPYYIFAVLYSHVVILYYSPLRETLYASTEVSSVIVPGAMGEYEVTADHVPIVAELKAGMMTIKHSDGEDEKYFVPGGFSLTHEGSTTVS